MANFLGGLLSAASSFLPGGGLLSKIIPGAVSAIGDIASKVINRPKGQGIGQALLEAAPDALANAAGLATTASQHLSQTRDATRDVGKSNEPLYDDGMGGSKKTRQEILNNIEEGRYSRDDTRNIARRGIFGPEFRDPEKFLKHIESKFGYVWNDEDEPKSTNATDHLPVIHGPPTQPALLVPSGPLSAHQMPPPTEYEKSTIPMATDRYRKDRTVPETSGASPSFNIFDRFSTPSVKESAKFNETEVSDDPRITETIRIIKKMKKAKKQKKKAKKGKT